MTILGRQKHRWLVSQLSVRGFAVLEDIIPLDLVDEVNADSARNLLRIREAMTEEQAQSGDPLVLGPVICREKFNIACRLGPTHRKLSEFCFQFIAEVSMYLNPNVSLARVSGFRNICITGLGETVLIDSHADKSYLSFVSAAHDLSSLESGPVAGLEICLDGGQYHGLVPTTRNALIVIAGEHSMFPRCAHRVVNWTGSIDGVRQTFVFKLHCT